MSKRKEFVGGATLMLHPNGTASMYRASDGRRTKRFSEAETRHLFGEAVVDGLKKSKPVKSTGSLVVESVDREAGVVMVGAKKGARK